ncbi:TetR/AcrR family transcriptional regulator [Empedobacter brevis]|uniref:TetR/AcrR family transcriptional regulator n=1 Tax=Empedobacter brevis TaxID=247 RepID=UPI0039B07C9E
MKDDTEELIKETAKRMFFTEGKFNATIQEIADEAKVNRTLINYYFRSRNNLIGIIYEEATRVSNEKSRAILDRNRDIKEMIGEFIEDSIATSIQYPYLETYIVTEMNKNKIMCSKFLNEDLDEVVNVFYDRLKEEMKKGTIETMEPIQFLLNMLSLINYPFAIRPLLQSDLQLNDADFKRILSDRKEIILNTLFKNK